MPDLVDDARTAGPHLVRLPQQGDFLGERRLDAPPPSRGERGIVEPGEKPAQAEVRGENRSPRRLGRMGGQDELEGESACSPSDPRLVHSGVLELGDRLGERLSRTPLLVLVLSPAAQPVMLFGKVDELEVRAERAQDQCALLVVERGDDLPEPPAKTRASARTGVACELSNPLLLVE